LRVRQRARAHAREFLEIDRSISRVNSMSTKIYAAGDA
jgi:hypothetical protein